MLIYAKMFRFLLVIGFVCGVLKSVWALPLPQHQYGTTPIQFIPIGLPPSLNTDIRAPNRIFFDQLGTFIQSASFLPIEINVPDTINTIYNGAVGAAQRFPLINRWITGTEPRPYPNLFILLPMGHPEIQPQKHDQLMEKFLGLHLPFQDLKYKPKKKKPTEVPKETPGKIQGEDTKKIIGEKNNQNCTTKNDLVEPEDIEANKVLMEYLERVKEHNKLFKNGIHGNRLIVPEPIMPTYLDTNVRDNNDFGFIRGGGYGLYPFHQN
ncbi:uncharacterized protein LOC123291570 [Chrysoperla carnea]|uniref:uncharacterized protein LOC123291570 n=1 Tax=Chrysoperla carnea TaxID=189513 RepID=UPI001D09795E|nr:uncharacterized protein LOC123291570 [Chrysoperla carnea]